MCVRMCVCVSVCVRVYVYRTTCRQRLELEAVASGLCGGLSPELNPLESSLLATCLWAFAFKNSR